jgi:hypothetical protein
VGGGPAGGGSPGLHDRREEGWGNPPGRSKRSGDFTSCARGATPLPCPFSSNRTCEAPPRARGAELLQLWSVGWGRSGAGDGRSVFHSRVNYRMNAFRRGPTSDLVRASAQGRPMGRPRIALTSAPPPTRRAGESSHLWRRRSYLLTNRPKETRKLSRYGSCDNGRPFAARGESSVAIA